MISRVTVFLALVLPMGCAHTATSWTPDTVAPPPVPTEFEAPAPVREAAAPIAIPENPDPATPLPITRDGAILTGLLGNRFIEVSRFDPEIEATFVDEARADFDPRVLARVSTGREPQRSFGATTTTTGNTTSTGSAGGSVVQQLQQLQRNLNSLNRESSGGTIRTNEGSVEFEQFLPTGNMLFLTGGALEEENDGDGVQDSWSVGLSQPLLRGANMRANLAGLRQARNAVAQSEQEFRLNVMDVVRQIELSYWNLVLAREVVAIRQFAVRLAEEQMRREEELLAVGKALRGDVITAGAERAEREADLADARAALESETIELIRLMHPSDQPQWELTLDPVDPAEVVEIKPEAEQSERLALAYRPELAQARLGLANLELDVLRARNNRLPRLDVVGTYGSGGAGTQSALRGITGNDDEDSYNIGLEFETGIPNRAGRAQYRRAQLANRRGDSEIAMLEENIAADVRRAIVEVVRQWQRLVATSEAVLSRQEAVRVVQGRREVGMATNLDVLQVERDYIESQVDDATARVRYVQALTNLYMAEGTLLDRRGISMEAMEQEDKPLGTPGYEAD